MNLPSFEILPGDLMVLVILLLVAVFGLVLVLRAAQPRAGRFHVVAGSASAFDSDFPDVLSQVPEDEDFDSDAGSQDDDESVRVNMIEEFAVPVSM